MQQKNRSKPVKLFDSNDKNLIFTIISGLQLIIKWENRKYQLIITSTSFVQDNKCNEDVIFIFKRIEPLFPLKIFIFNFLLGYSHLRLLLIYREYKSK
jgi:hypothetical protein